jgi:hypothetical protein
VPLSPPSGPLVDALFLDEFDLLYSSFMERPV